VQSTHRGVKMKKTKIDIISGFLGAGKTTFIKKLMEGVLLAEKVVILENEFGKINIDQETLGREGLTVKPIQAGCICCTSSMDLSGGIYEIIREYNPDRIIVEPTGIAKLSEIKKLLQYKEIEELCGMDHIITIVDAKNYYLRTMISKDFFENQIRASEVIFLSKTDEMDEEKKYKVIAELYKIKPSCQVISDPWDSIPAETLKNLIEIKMGLKNEVTAEKQQLRLRINHVNDFESYEVVRADNVNIVEIKLFIKDIENNRFGEVHRLKGICTDSKLGLYSVEYVPGETVINLLPSGNIQSQSKICLIGRNIETKKMDELFKLIKL
jgi:G3E family GTPase